jgi:thiol-disulfide isomerase/thioredoxin
LSGRLRGLAMLLAAMAVAAGCSRAPAAGEPAWQQAAEQQPPPAISTEIAVPASLKFTGTTLDGAAFDASSLAGKPALLWFWAPWCATCASEAQSIGDLAKEYQGRLGILGIAGMGNNKDMHEFVADFKLEHVPHLDDEAGKIWKRFKITEQSLYVVIDRDGQVRKTGYLDDLQLTNEVKSLVA